MDYKVKLAMEKVNIQQENIEKKIKINGEEHKARISLENQFYIDDATKEEQGIRILMLKGEKGDAGASGDYNSLENKPQINAITLQGNKTAYQLNLQETIDRITNSDIEYMLDHFVEEV